MKSDRKGLLCIHYYYPPIHSIGVVRNYYLSNELQKYHNPCLILTTSNRKVLPTSNEFKLNEKVIDVLETKDYRTQLTNKKSAHFKEEQKSSKFAQFGIKLINSYPFNVLMGEGGKKYVAEGISKGSKFLTNNVDSTIYTSFRPYADLFIGYKLKLAFPKSKWIVDFRDLHVDPMYKNVYLESMQHKFNKKMLTKADLIITVSNGLKEQLSQYSDRVACIYNGCDISNESEIIHNKKFIINYTGSLFGEHRDPSSLFKFLKACMTSGEIVKHEFQIQYAGKDQDKFEKYISDYGLESVYENKGLVSREESLKLQREANLNLLLTSVTKELKGILTGKLFEYIGSLSSILALVSGHKDPEIEETLCKVEGGRVWYPFEENESTKEWILEIYSEWRDGKERKNLRANVEKHLSWKSSGNLIMDYLKNGVMNNNLINKGYV